MFTFLSNNLSLEQVIVYFSASEMGFREAFRNLKKNIYLIKHFT